MNKSSFAAIGNPSPCISQWDDPIENDTWPELREGATFEQKSSSINETAVDSLAPYKISSITFRGPV